MFKSLLIALSFLTVATVYPAMAQINTTESDPDVLIDQRITLNRAKNLARAAAEKANGGLSNYRAESSMHGPAINSPFVQNEDGSITFTILGRTPQSTEYTIETVVIVAPDTSTVEVEYNGPIRPENSLQPN